MAGKNLVFLVVGLVVVAVVAVCVWQFVLNDDKDDGTTTYWFYIDYGVYETSETENEWISGEGKSAYDGLCAA
ncbi:MAG: hypothetical protein LBH88_02630, partial [Candidatus Methanoplasma sp.]|nr:hypothetical protein [Candidatus Methanoplasma sp.]